MRHFIWMTGFALGLAACGDPLRDVERLGDVSLADGSATVSERQSEARSGGGGLFGRLLNRAPEDPTSAAIEAALADVGVDPETQVTEAETGTEAAPEQPRRGLAGLFRRSPASDGPRDGPDGDDVEAGTVLSFGEIARVCDVSRNRMGQEVEAVGDLRIYDTFPNSTARRPFYITGFDDNCARTFTGALVISGDVASHEFVRYQPSNERIAYTEVDNAYEALKANVCRVGRGQPCGARTDQLSRNTQFITVYGLFADSLATVPNEWVQILVHNGRVLAISQKRG